MNFILNILFITTLRLSPGGTKQVFEQRRVFNSSDFYSNWDTSNIPESIVNRSSITVDEVLDVLATKRYRSCKASVLYHPLTNVFFFRDPSQAKAERGKGKLKDYIPLRCRKFGMRNVGAVQRFLLPFKDIEAILDNNEDTILLESIHEFTNIRNGLEMSLFPVKFFKALDTANYTYKKDLLCYDSIKVLGMDKNNNDYYIISALNTHNILYCDGTDVNKRHNMNNFIRYSAYCDEFCAEDFVYFSSDLIKCKCDFFAYVEELKLNKKYLTPNNHTDGLFHNRRVDRYEIFANPYEFAEKLTKYETLNKPYFRYYLHMIIVLFTFQMVYASYFTTKNSVFIKFTIIFYIMLATVIYIPHRVKLENLDYVKLFEVISDLYPVGLLVVVACNPSGRNSEVLMLSSVIFINSYDYIFKETRVNELELTLRLCLIIITCGLGNTFDLNFLKFYADNVKLRYIFEFVSRLLLYFVDKNFLLEATVPLFIVLGRPREHYVHSDHVLFQSNYLKLKPNFENLYDNWFMEALNYHKLKNMIFFLKMTRFGSVILILSLINLTDSFQRGLSNMLILKFERFIFLFIKMSYKNLINVFYSQNNLINYPHMLVHLSLLYTNVLVTKDSLKFFLIHFGFGWLTAILTDNVQSAKRPNLGRVQ